MHRAPCGDEVSRPLGENTNLDETVTDSGNAEEIQR